MTKPNFIDWTFLASVYRLLSKLEKIFQEPLEGEATGTNETISSKVGNGKMGKKFIVKDFIIITLLTSIWVNISELIRFFAYVKPEMQSFLSGVPNVMPMNEVGILLIWGAWDTLLSALYVYLFWLCAQVFGNNRKSIWMSGIMSWAFFFVLFWVASANMNLASWSSLLIVLPLTLLETVVATFIASKLYRWRNL